MRVQRLREHHRRQTLRASGVHRRIAEARHVVVGEVTRCGPPRRAGRFGDDCRHEPCGRPPVGEVGGDDEGARAERLNLGTVARVHPPTRGGGPRRRSRGAPARASIARSMRRAAPVTRTTGRDGASAAGEGARFLQCRDEAVTSEREPGIQCIGIRPDALRRRIAAAVAEAGGWLPFDRWHGASRCTSPASATTPGRWPVRPDGESGSDFVHRARAVAPVR